MQIVTNNLKVRSSHPRAKFIAGGPREVLIECRRMVHEGYPLLCHPLMGDVRLLVNPFRSVILGDKKEDLHLISLRWIEESIERIHSICPRSKEQEGLDDYQTVDYELVQSAIRQGSMHHRIGSEVGSVPRLAGFEIRI